ncbi:MAG: Maf family protein, partial [Bacteroidales bacterium]|nr:Maf family protein [Bacteroidales bacterium]
MKLILCSGSPRRRELITEMGLEFTIDKETSYVEDMAALVAKFESEAGGKCSGESG